jgi:membrane protein implicated in regulation of membrane protease activity
MGWIVFEALLALAVMLAVVWWTFRGRAEDAPDDDADADAPADKR